MNTLEKLVVALSAPLGLINIVGGFIAGIWLLILGEGEVVFYGVGAMLASIIVIMITMLPNLLFFSYSDDSIQNTHKIRSYTLRFTGEFYTSTVITVWCLTVLYFLLNQTNDDTQIPILIWSYEVATGLFSMMWLQEIHENYQSFAVFGFFAPLAYLMAIIAILIFSVSFLDVTILFTSIMFIGCIYQFRLNNCSKHMIT